MGGILFNSRELADEYERVLRFADAVRLPIIASFPRSPEIGAAEQLGQTVLQAFPEGTMAGLFAQTAGNMRRFASPLQAHPLSPDDLDAVVLRGAHRSSYPLTVALPVPARERPIPDEAPQRRRHARAGTIQKVSLVTKCLHGCAFNGAAHTLMQIQRYVDVGPRAASSCAYISHNGMTSAAGALQPAQELHGDRSLVGEFRDG
jgi:hypothetical protein